VKVAVGLDVTELIVETVASPVIVSAPLGVSVE
jgi:hypothetical protein